MFTIPQIVKTVGFLIVFSTIMILLIKIYFLHVKFEKLDSLDTKK